MRKHIEWTNGAYGFDTIEGPAFYRVGGDRVVSPKELSAVTSRGVSVWAIRAAAEGNATLDQIEDGLRNGLRLYGIQDRVNYERTRESMKSWRGNWPKIADAITAGLRGEYEFG